MDIHDVSDVPKYFETLQAQQRTLDLAQARKGQSPFPLPPPMLLISRFNMGLMAKTLAATSQDSPKQRMLRSSHTPAPYPPCTQPFTALKKIAIRELVLETQHRGRYLLVRSVTPPDQMTGLIAVVEDEVGDAIMLQLYHQDDNMHSSSTTSDTLPQGQVLILKEPYLKVMANGNYGLRADHLSDVLFLAARDDDERVPGWWRRSLGASKKEALAWKLEGNDHFKKLKYLSAIACYTHALDCSPTAEEAQTIKLNRALAYLKTNQFDAALSDVEPMAGHNPLPPPQKGLFRKAEALYHLRRYREACEVLKALLLAYRNNKDAQALLNRAIKRLAEETYGRYSFKRLQDETATLRPPHLDHGTFIGPVAVRQAGSRGRGLFATAAVKAGDLLFCEKAFTHAFVDEEGDSGSSSDITILMEPGSRVTMGGQPDLINKTIRKLYRNPSLIPIITDLHHGSYKPVEVSSVDGQPIVDSFLIRRIISLNSFGCPTLSTLQHAMMRRSRKLGDEESAGAGTGPAKREQEDDDDGPWHSVGLWPLASYINHSCTSNARRSFIGDMMVARATRDLEPDTEITWWYRPPELGTDSDTKRDLGKKGFAHWGFTCDCSLCRDEMENCVIPAATLQKRSTLLAGLKKYLSSRTSLPSGSSRSRSRLDTLKKARTFVAAMQTTYPRSAKDFPRLALWQGLQMGLMDVMRASTGGYPTPQQQEELLLTAELIVEALSSLGYVIEGGISGNTVGRTRTSTQTLVVREWGLFSDGLVDLWMFLRDVYRILGADDPMLAAIEGYAKTAYRIMFGEDETFTTFGGAALSLG